MTSRTMLLILALVPLTFALGCGGTSTTGALSGTDGEPPAPTAGVRDNPIVAGDVEYGSPQDYPFVITNTGKTPLTLSLTRKSCHCAEFTMPTGDVPPGGQATVNLRWAPIYGTPTVYSVIGEVATNDPKTPSLRLELKARVLPKVRFWPDNDTYIDFGDTPLRRNEAAERELKVYSTELPAFTLSVSATHPGLEVVAVPLPAGATVTGEAIKSGYLVTMRTTPKLPQGYVREDVTIVLKEPGQPERTIPIPVYALVGNGVFQVRPDKFSFKKPRLTEEDSQKVRVEFFVPSDKESVEVVKVEPSWMIVEKPVRVGRGRWDVVTRIPKDHPEAARIQPDQFLEGRVILKTSGDDSEVPVRIRWTPEE